MKQKRINLCFDLDDTKQRIAFNYLNTVGREKTATIVNLILQNLLPMSNEKIMNNDLIQQIEQIAKENNLFVNIDAMHSDIKLIISQLETIQLNFQQLHTDAGEKHVKNQNTEIEMNEDAFSSMMSFLG